MKVSEGDTRGMTLIVKTVTRLTLGFILLYGIYIALNGDHAPGGGFAGGVIVALSFVHIMLAFGKRAILRSLGYQTLRVVMGASAIIFLSAVVAGLLGRSVPAAVLPLCEMLIIGPGLFLIFVSLVLISKSEREWE